MRTKTYVLFVLLSEKKKNIHGYNGKKNAGKALVGLEDYP